MNKTSTKSLHTTPLKREGPCCKKGDIVYARDLDGEFRAAYVHDVITKHDCSYAYIILWCTKANSDPVNFPFFEVSCDDIGLIAKDDKDHSNEYSAEGRQTLKHYRIGDGVRLVYPKHPFSDCAKLDGKIGIVAEIRLLASMIGKWEFHYRIVGAGEDLGWHYDEGLSPKQVCINAIGA